MTEFIVPGVLGAAAILAAAGFLVWRRPMAAGTAAARVLSSRRESTRPLEEPAPGSHGESIVIDPVAMKIVNRVAAGSRQTGVLHCEGGLMVEGTIEGEVHVSEDSKAVAASHPTGSARPPGYAPSRRRCEVSRCHKRRARTTIPKGRPYGLPFFMPGISSA